MRKQKQTSTYTTFWAFQGVKNKVEIKFFKNQDYSKFERTGPLQSVQPADLMYWEDLACGGFKAMVPQKISKFRGHELSVPEH